MASPLTTARLIFGGFALVLVLYGVYFTLSVICIHYLLSNKERNNIVLAYTVTSLLVSTIFLAASAKYTELLFLESAINPVGTATLASRLDLLQQVVYSVKIWLADSLLIYRLWVIWSGMYAITIIPSILFTGALATGIAGVSLYYQTTKHTQIVDLGIGFHSCSVALNVIATSLIAGKLLYQRKVVKDLGEDHSRQYLSLMAVFAESGALYSITGIIYIPLYATNSSLIYIFAPLLEAASGIAPSLILLRIALGVAVSNKPRHRISSLRFEGQKAQRSTGMSLTAFSSQGISNHVSSRHAVSEISVAEKEGSDSAEEIHHSRSHIIEHDQDRGEV